MQSQNFGGSTSVSIEGDSVHYRQLTNYNLTLDFHSFLSDSKVQHASTVYNHMDKLLAKLKTLGALKDHGKVLSMTNGCASQYRSATSLFWMVMNTKKHNVVLDRGICCAGHGKSIVDIINGVDKNTIIGYTMRSVLTAKDALNKKSKSIQVHSFDNASGENILLQLILEGS